MKAQIIGTDVSLEVCKNEGYLQMEMVRKFNPHYPYHVFAYYPDYIIEESKGRINPDAMIVDTHVSLTDLLEMYERHEKGINSFVGQEYSKKLKDYDFYSFLNLADSVNAYCGLD